MRCGGLWGLVITTRVSVTGIYNLGRGGAFEKNKTVLSFPSSTRSSWAMETDSDAASRASLIISFCHMTSASHDDALFFLESHNFDLDAAISSFNNSASQPHFQSPSPATAQHVDPKNPSETSTLSNLKQPPSDDTDADNSGEVIKKDQMRNKYANKNQQFG